MDYLAAILDVTTRNIEVLLKENKRTDILFRTVDLSLLRNCNHILVFPALSHVWR